VSKIKENKCDKTLFDEDRRTLGKKETIRVIHYSMSEERWATFQYWYVVRRTSLVLNSIDGNVSHDKRSIAANQNRERRHSSETIVDLIIHCVEYCQARMRIVLLIFIRVLLSQSFSVAPIHNDKRWKVTVNSIELDKSRSRVFIAYENLICWQII
jgi:hypothetical protein